jgi:hypothetical protein
MKEAIGRLVYNGQGDERDVYSFPQWPQFPDKKRSFVDPLQIENAVRQVKKIKEDAEVGQREATWIPQLEYPDRPMLFLFLTDVHYASIRSEHDLLNYYLDTVMEVPNMFVVTGGDDCDNFNVGLGKVSDGTYEDPIEPGIQAKGWQKKIGRIDQAGKLGFMVFGNHTDWDYHTGKDWYDTFLGHIEAPILTSGGLVRTLFNNGARYDIAATHRYWGSSKLNPTNTSKRYLEHEYPSADIILTGHTHQSEVLHFERGGKERIAIIGGTLKLYEDYARKHGIGGRAGTPGNCVELWPDKQLMIGYKNFDLAVGEHIGRLR